jgi:putative IMPACT (imprinted ancient) family translation regulator
VALAAPVADEAAARQLLAEQARRHHDARHVCFAWRGGPGSGGPGADGRELRSDAGEPAGTAGEPILAALRHAGLAEAIVVVARWFGGVKLGPGGLSRAYGAAATAALAAAPRRLVVPGAEHRLRFAYALEKTIAHLLERHDGRVVRREYGPQVDWRVWLPNATRAAFATGLAEATAGAVALDNATGGEESG